jgi:uncharacterized protein YbjT (DUF2867 family)
MTSPILVTGGTGTLGRQVVPRLRDAGGEVRVELALGPPAGRVPDVGGPRVYEPAELVRGYLPARDRRSTHQYLTLP